MDNKNEKGFCFECEDYKDVEIKENVENICIKGKELRVTQYSCHCKECGGIATREDIEEKNDKIAFNAYKKEVGLLTTEEIKRIREKYDISQKNLAKILGLGEKTITRYEKGTIQEKANDNLLKLIDNVNDFEKLWNERKGALESSAIKRTEKQLKLLNKQMEYKGMAFNYNFKYKTDLSAEGRAYNAC